MAEPDFDKMSPEELSEYQRQNCVFCKIVRDEIPSRKVFEDDKVLCIMDIYPAAKGHVLLLTKEHYPFLPVIPPALSAHMFRVTRGISKALKGAVVSDKITLFIANGGVAGQQAPHFIYHLIPREANDGLELFSLPSKDAQLAESEKIAPLVKQRLAAYAQAFKSKPAVSATQAAGQAAPQKPGDFQELARMILDNPPLKELIVKDPEGFKKELEKDPDVKKLFVGVDVNKLASALGKMK